jgi:hypothetical protein
MLGFSIIKTKELQRLRHIDEVFCKQNSEKNEVIRLLEAKVDALTPKRDDKGKFSKK